MRTQLAAAAVDETVARPDFLPEWNALGLGNILGWALQLVFVGAGLIVLYNLIFGALEWIQSGGDKEKVEKARKKITTAVTGLVILFVVLGAVVLIEQIFGFGLGFTEPIKISKFATVN
jgi:hypothetical protein